MSVLYDFSLVRKNAVHELIYLRSFWHMSQLTTAPIMARLGWLLAIFLLTWAMPALAADGGRGLGRVAGLERRVALVIGNSGYRHVTPLDNPSHDAELIADTLHNTLDFELVGGKALLDLDKSGMDRAIQAFGNQLRPDTVALFYYSGHGVEMEDNYLIPIDANPNKTADFDFQALKAQTVLRQMQDAGTRLNIVILDACRNNPFKGRGLKAASAGLKSMEAPEGTLIAYAAEEGKTARDGPTGGNSPYASALELAFKQRGLGLWETFNTVALQVAEATGKTQVPWISNSPIKGRFYFLPPEETATVSSATITDPEQSFWDDIKNSADPADFSAYLTQFPAGRHAELAKNKRDRLTAAIAIASGPGTDFGRPHPNPPPAGEGTIPEPASVCDYCPEMVKLPGGEFMMGSEHSDKVANSNEKPRRTMQVGAIQPRQI